MNQLIIPDGGMPLEGDDIRWMYQGLLDALKGGALYPFALQHSGNFIIAGCEISFTGGNASVTEGFVMLNYEICYCPAHTVAVTSLAASSLKVLETYDASGAEVFADSITRDTYAIRRARISANLNNAVEIVLQNPPRYYYKHFPILQNDWQVFDGNTVVVEKIGNQVFVQGVVTNGTNNLVAFDLFYCFIPSQFKRKVQSTTPEIVVGIEAAAAGVSIYKAGVGEVPVFDVIHLDFSFTI
ncbi:MAG TPA: hypothetical protein PKD70_06235 [Saprospiraceae bacterium]|nr:hypothetical protein [Saprospiraceae bacterium]HMP13456.1 hypothetical protein [Saprospiraceae bacterium]